MKQARMDLLHGTFKEYLDKTISVIRASKDYQNYLERKRIIRIRKILDNNKTTGYRKEKRNGIYPDWI